jgi:hypothetical protein
LDTLPFYMNVQKEGVILNGWERINKIIIYFLSIFLVCSLYDMIDLNCNF